VSITVLTTWFPNGPSYSVFPADGGPRLFSTRSHATLSRWLRRHHFEATE
jgi:hypothetical protein